MKKQAKRGSISKRLGIPTAARLTSVIIRKKLSILKGNLRRKKYKGELLDYAKYYLSWYSMRLKTGPRKRKVVSKNRRKKLSK